MYMDHTVRTVNSKAREHLPPWRGADYRNRNYEAKLLCNFITLHKNAGGEALVVMQRFLFKAVRDADRGQCRFELTTRELEKKTIAEIESAPLK